ncbi:SusC/RagA family TonB-linked outer membrane protein [Pseudogemmatithrix spongiicola]|uniref:SusC/RagA family TonB-linked outer membrane protein n=2 Tax=Pseudogemmatithrix spongiicola TaxID=3062599 RepID=A0AA49K0J5_9BACT|nr:SusC/RagA family TonB-linked outer membrane protein [Gemmatimonadaceae bacterium 'strain 318']
MPGSLFRAVRGVAMLATLLVGPSLAAQQATGVITGRVTVRGTQDPVGDARVIVVGTAIAVFTNANGEYRINTAPIGRAQVTVYKIGYSSVSDTVTVSSAQPATLNLAMAQTRVQLSEVVVTGAVGNTERRAQGAAVATVNAEELAAQSPAQSFSQLLQSRVPSVSVNSASGTAGTSRRINIRGAASINLSNQPLIFIDGVRIVEGQPGLGVGGQSADRLNNINPDDIESIEVVKGPAAATLYGADASAGVIQIITKAGRSGTPRFQQRLSLESGSVDQNWTPPDNYARCRAVDTVASSLNPLCRGQALNTLVSDNPLVREDVFRVGSLTNMSYSINGGGQGYGYYFAVNNDRQQGTLPNNAFGRQGIRTNFNFVPNSKVTVNASIGIQQSELDAPQNDNNIYGYLGGAFLGTPLSRTDDGSGNDGWFGFNRGPEEIAAIETRLVTRGTTAGATVTFVPMPWFTHKLTLGGDLVVDEYTNYFPRNGRQAYAGLLNTGSNTQNRTNSERYTVDYNANARNTFGGGDWELNTTAGLQLISTRTNFLGSTGTGFVTNSNNVISSASQTSGVGSLTDVRQRGWIGQVQLGHLNRRFLTLATRVDEFSVFGSDVDPAVLPTIRGSWVISEEDFFQPMSNIASSLRLRAAYGTTGRAPGAGAALTTLAAAPSIIGTSSEAGAVPANPGNPNLKPETGKELEIGFDAGFFNERLGLEFTYFNKTTNDLILSRPLPPSLGFTQDPQVNIGEVVNRGIEVAVNATLYDSPTFTWDVRGGFNTLYNELVDLGDVPAFNTLNRFTEGYPLGAFVSKRIRNIDEATGVVTVADTFEVVGSQFPGFEGTLTSTFTLFRQLRISAQFDTKQDYLVYNNTDFFRETQLVRSNARLDTTVLSRRERLKRYGNPTPGQPAFRQENGASTTVNEVRDYYLQPGDFVRFRELGVTWDIPAKYATRMPGVATASLGFAVQNVALWKDKDFTGPDPEVISAAGAQFNRTDFLTLPNPRTTVLRLNITF